MTTELHELAEPGEGMAEPLRHVRLAPYREGNPSFELEIGLAGYADDSGSRVCGPRTYVEYRLTQVETDGSRFVIFHGSDIGLARSGACEDSDETVRSVLGWLTLRPGDTDSEFFENDTPEQVAYREQHAESLSMFAGEPSEEYPVEPFENLDGWDE